MEVNFELSGIPGITELNSKPIGKHSQNFDFSTFPMLCQRTYFVLQKINNEVSRKLPLCAFLHHCTVALTCTLMELRNEFWDKSRAYLNEMMIPAPIAEYLSLINDTRTPNGHTVEVNIPKIAIPYDSGESAGTFGPVNKDTHNVYECYVSPRVTRRLIEATLAQDHNWRPLPETLMDETLKPTHYFLGYINIVEHIDSEMQKIFQPTFPADESASFEARIQYSPEIADLNNAMLKEMSSEYKMSVAAVEKKHILGYTGFIEPKLTEINKDIYYNILSTSSFNEKLGSIFYLFGHRKYRSDDVPGFCCSFGNTSPEEWFQTKNYNFNAQGLFELNPSYYSIPYYTIHHAKSQTNQKLLEVDSFVNKGIIIKNTICILHF